ncbi:adenine/guanine phosphoribosyltransferase-like PRPP-binding protein [Rhizobium sp. ERR 922]|uniref:Phosphoribosyltransferase n=1 Tax=Rhizobium dioscoreae TaxID=2653122 RepID=A0ABQ0ZCC4_9HYPH|nr:MULTISPECIES: phosphoribosyltransferase [Rhizobium]MCZ3380336.1 phosphoribosyltransferase [Rhizobium sp. AG207R]TWB44013.1 adenine/guanine phosphoribosyltransferase-like PRPP-binding protein [Rhizobium sp. ERR 922]TWB87637.1 adenine/guanine phosphoribosyltransferase-like PRPP-binding protein [Rhizobium sp. ERR 942]GES52952.1 phosphoribosyltransferase [Rhizobium dioscoreae]GLU84490.1 phosphoribosyltransferase [Rhizobium sp. NBRC 114257]
MQPHDFWQELHAPDTFDPMAERTDFHVAELPDGRQLRLPIRVLADGEHALASLIVNQASFTVLEALAEALVERIAAYDIDVVAGLPTLGLTLAAAVARARGHARYVPLGTSRKFWYRDELSVTLSSITTPNQEKRLYIDPRMLPLLQGKRVALIDDVISSGASIVSGLALLASCNIEPVVIGAAMLQSDRWRDRVDLNGKRWSERIVGVFSTPILEQGENGCWRRPG